MKHVLITGSTRGIGFQMARSFLKSGWKVTVNGASDASVKNALGLLKKEFSADSFQGISADISKAEEVEKLASKAQTFGPIDIWVNNAGINQKSAFAWELKREDILKIFETNFSGMMNGTFCAFKLMQEQGFGRIYNMEGLGSDGMMIPKTIIYGTSKSALRYFTRGMEKEAKDTPVKIGTISPGMVLTDFLLKSEGREISRGMETQKVYKILADKPETVAPFLVKKMIQKDKNGTHIFWLTKPKVFFRFLTAGFRKNKK